MKTFIGIILLAVASYAGNFSLTTGFTSYFDITKGTVVNNQDTTLFLVQEGRFTHITPTMSSTYIQYGVTNLDVGENKIQVVPVRSEVNNYYLYIFDIPNRKIIAYSADQNFIVEFDIIKNSGDE